MHTIIMIVAGLLGLALVSGAGLILGGARGVRMASRWFLGAWLLVSLANGAIGYFHAGIPLSTELAVFVPIFGVPAVVAIYASRRVARDQRA